MHKHLFCTPTLDLDVGVSIPVTVGYETYGRLSPAHDNAILICHPFSGSSHAAGLYHPDDPALGWWDSLIGPGKAFDTDRYHIIAVDSLCNIAAKDPRVITTGPASIDPATGRPYGMTFPQVTIRDNVRLQHQLLTSLGISRLVAVAGPGLGGFQALEWAVTYPRVPQRVIGVATAHIAPPLYAITACHAAIRTLEVDPGTDPADALARAELMRYSLAHSDAWAAELWARKTAPGSAHPWADREGRYAFQSELEKLVAQRVRSYDPHHFIYTARAAMLHDIGYGNGGLDGATRKIEARVLLLPIDTDLQFPPALSQDLANALTDAGGRVQLHILHAPHGHAAAVCQAHLLAEPITHFLRKGDLH